MTSRSMRHWNGNVCVSIDINTTGSDQSIHEIVQISAIPLTSSFDNHPDYLPFQMFLRPNSFEHANEDSTPITIETKRKIMMYGVSHDQGYDMFCNWIEKLKIPASRRGGKYCGIIPLGYRYEEIAGSWLRNWMTIGAYNTFFSDRSFDPCIVAQHMNNMAEFNIEQVPYSKLNIKWLAKQHAIDSELYKGDMRDAQARAVLAAKIYKAQCQDIAYLGWNR